MRCVQQVILLSLLISSLPVGSGCGSPYSIPGQDRFAAVANPPPIRGEEIVAFPDPSHVRLRDGRTYRLLDVTDYGPAAPEFTWHRNRLRKFLDDARDDGRPLGLRPVDSTDGGEEVAVEFWSYPAPIGVCGNSTRAEIRRIQRHWYNIHDEVLFVVEGRRTGRFR
jgi:hypothetical protein